MWLLLSWLTAVSCIPFPSPAALPTLVPTADLTALIPPATASPTPPIPTLLPTNLPPTATALPTAVPPTPTAPPTAPPTPTIAAAATYQLTLTPGNPQPYLTRFRLVAYYGSPTGRGLGILGETPRPEMTAALRETAASFLPYSPNHTILPTYHMVILVANPHPPAYFHRVDLDLLAEWVAAAAAAETAVILDMQPGRGNILAEFERVRHLLYQPHVHLAIDPEFVMNSQQIPGQQIGQLDAATINAVQAELDQIARDIGLNRVLILHQFTPAMLPDKAAIIDYPFVELVIDGDGVGADRAKVRNYNQYAAEPAFEFGGFKLFPTDGDYPVMTVDEVMTQLQPPPVLIIYQ